MLTVSKNAYNYSIGDMLLIYLYFSRYSIAELLSPKNTPPPVEGCTGKETKGKMISNNFFPISSYIRYLIGNQVILG